MPAIEILAIIFAVIVIIKIIFLIIKPQLGIQLANKLLFKNTLICSIIYVILIIIVGFFIFTNIPIAQVSAVLLFSFTLLGLALIPYCKSMIDSMAQTLQSRKDVLKKMWLPILIYLIIAIYTLLVIIQPT